MWWLQEIKVGQSQWVSNGTRTISSLFKWFRSKERRRQKRCDSTEGDRWDGSERRETVKKNTSIFSCMFTLWGLYVTFLIAATAVTWTSAADKTRRGVVMCSLGNLLKCKLFKNAKVVDRRRLYIAEKSIFSVCALQASCWSCIWTTTGFKLCIKNYFLSGWGLWNASV